MVDGVVEVFFYERIVLVRLDFVFGVEDRIWEKWLVGSIRLFLVSGFRKVFYVLG